MRRRASMEWIVKPDTDPVFRPPSAVDRVAQHLRELALNLPEGAYIGSEQSLAGQYLVSGPTLRQATRLLEHEGLIKVRRGVRGGYYANRPRIDAVTRAAATYLLGIVVSYEEVVESPNDIVPILVDRVMASARLAGIRVYCNLIRSVTPEDFIEQQTTFMKSLMDLIDHAPLRLFAAILYQTVASLPLEASQRLTAGERAIEEARVDLAEALLSRDQARAIAVYRHANDLVGDAIKNHLNDAPRSGN